LILFRKFYEREEKDDCKKDEENREEAGIEETDLEKGGEEGCSQESDEGCFGAKERRGKENRRKKSNRKENRFEKKYHEESRPEENHRESSRKESLFEGDETAPEACEAVRAETADGEGFAENEGRNETGREGRGLR